MGEKALRLFEEARTLGGLVGTMRLASIARVSSAEAAGIEDTVETIRKLEEGLRQLREERQRAAARPAEGAIFAASSGADQARVLRKHVQTYVELVAQRALFLGDVTATARRVNEAATAAIDVERVSVWLLDAKQSKITCLDLYERTKRRHSSGVELLAKDFAPYFEALRSERTIAAHDARKDPRTSCFAASYLEPLGITSMLDVPIWQGQRMAGVVCHEHVGRARRWDGDEENFAYLMSSFASMALDRTSARQ